MTENEAEAALRTAIATESLVQFSDFMAALARVATGPDPRAFAERTAPLVREAHAALTRWRRAYFDGVYSGGEEEVLWALNARTHLEYARAIYRGTVAEEIFADIGDDEMDADLHQRAVDVRLDTPPHVPASHTWWPR